MKLKKNKNIFNNLKSFNKKNLYIYKFFLLKPLFLKNINIIKIINEKGF